MIRAFEVFAHFQNELLEFQLQEEGLRAAEEAKTKPLPKPMSLKEAKDFLKGAKFPVTPYNLTLAFIQKMIEETILYIGENHPKKDDKISLKVACSFLLPILTVFRQHAIQIAGLMRPYHERFFRSLQTELNLPTGPEGATVHYADCRSCW